LFAFLHQSGWLIPVLSVIAIAVIEAALFLLMRSSTYETRKKLEGICFILPWIAGFLIFMAFPLGSSLYLSFRQSVVTEFFGGNFVGLNNYVNVVTDVYFGTYFTASLSNALIDIPVIVIFSMFVAVLLNRRLAGRTFFRQVFFLPVIISGAIMVSMADGSGTVNFSTMFGQGLGSLVNLLGRGVIDRLGIILWQSSVQILIFLAGLQTISSTVYEAAQIDGASSWEMFWKITVPQMSPIIILNIIYSIIDSFTNASNRIIELVKISLFNKLDFGYSAALSWIYFIIILLMILLIFVVSKLLTRNDMGVRRVKQVRWN